MLLQDFLRNGGTVEELQSLVHDGRAKSDLLEFALFRLEVTK